MKCPKCSLVTFDHLSKCPKCGQTFRLQRRLTRVRPDPDRRIVLPGSESPTPAPRQPQPPPERPAPRAEAETAAPAPVRPTPAAVPAPPRGATVPPDDLDLAPAPTPERARDTPPPVPSITASDLGQRPRAEARAELPAEPAAAPDATAAAAAAPAAESRDPEPPRRSIFAADLAPDTEEPPVPPEWEPEPVAVAATIDPHTADALRLKQRMIANSQQRRKEGHDLVSDSVDPILPDWYDPTSLEEEDEAAVTAPPAKR